MRVLFLTAVSVLLVSCGTGLRQTAKLPRALPPLVEPIATPESAPEREDSAEEAARFDLLRRTGGEPLPVERLLEAKRHARLMPVHKIPGYHALVAGSKTGGRDANVDAWQPLGPVAVGVRTTGLGVRPQDPNTLEPGTGS